MEMIRPTTSHEKLELLAGTWEGEEICHPSPWNPEVKRVLGRAEHRVALGGFHLLGDYEQVENGEVGFTGHGIYSYDESTDAYVCHWFDSMCAKASVLRGKWEDDTLELFSHDPQLGLCRLTYGMKDAEKGRYTFRLEISPDGDKWNLCMEGDYRRKD